MALPNSLYYASIILFPKADKGTMISKIYIQVRHGGAWEAEAGFICI